MSDDAPRFVRYWPPRVPSPHERPPADTHYLGGGASAHRRVLNVLRLHPDRPMTIEAVMEALGGVDRNDVRFVLSGLATHAAGDVKRVERGVYVYDGRAEWR